MRQRVSQPAEHAPQGFVAPLLRLSSAESDAPVCKRVRETSHHTEYWVGGQGAKVTEADMPWGESKAQIAFKIQFIRGPLQFTMRIAFRCVLRRCSSQGVHRCKFCKRFRTQRVRRIQEYGAKGHNEA
jgi:hypothetical protein